MASIFTGGLSCWDEQPTAPSKHSVDNAVKNTFELAVKPIQPKSHPSRDAKKVDLPQSSEVANVGGVVTAGGKVTLQGSFKRSSITDEEQRYQTVLSVGEQCIQPEELRALLLRKDHPICYDGFEPSGRMHIAQGILKAINVNKLTSSGCVFVFWVADWFACLNNKMGGDLAKIRVVGEYFIEVWKACGMDMNNVRFLWASEEINKDPGGYWERVIDIARNNTLSRVKRCTTITGRAEGDDQPSSTILYSCMQCSDIFFLQADICQLGMDQRRVNVLAREYCDVIKMKHKPVVLAHKMMAGLLEGQEKMSKSIADSAILMEDLPEDVNRKIKRAFCQPMVLDKNPCVEYVEALVFPKFGEFKVPRSEKNGGPITYKTVDEFRAAFVDGSLHPGDLKTGLAQSINTMLQPVRDHFKNNAKAKSMLETIKKWKKADSNSAQNKN